METQSIQANWLPLAKHYNNTKQNLQKIEKKLISDTILSQDKKENYLRVIRQMAYNMCKLVDRWPVQIDKIIDNLNSILLQFHNQLSAMSKGSSLFCGTGGNPKQLDSTFKRLAGYEYIFMIIRPFQDRRIRQEIIKKYQSQQFKKQDRRNISKDNVGNIDVKNQSKSYNNEGKTTQKCRNCQLMLAVSLCPNGYIAKKLIKQLPDTEWIAGILYQEGTIVDKNVDKAIEFYKSAYNKTKNYQALYRLGSLNERGLYGKPFQYLKMWEQASNNGHLEAMTDMGYLYEHGLKDQDGKRVIIQPNYQKALNYYKQAAQQNLPRALNNLATFYFNNQEFQDYKKSLEYFELATQAENVRSLYNLGVIYYQGKLVKTDDKKSRDLIRRSAQKGDIEGRIMQIELILSNIQNYTQEQLVQIHRYCRQIISKDQEKSQAYYYLGVIHQQGYGVQKQPKLSFLFYSIAASMKNAHALIKLAACYKNGFGIQQDLKQALRFYESAASQNKEALVMIGQIYQKGGEDVSINYQKAFFFYYEACNYGLPQAYKHLGNMYKYGRHVKKNDAKAEQYFQKARSIEKESQIKKLNSSGSGSIQSSYYRRK